MTHQEMKRSVSETVGRLMESVFTSDIFIRQSNVPVFVATCTLALAGSMIFGMYFAKQEAQSLHGKERAELVSHFALIMKTKDEQLEGITNVLIVNQEVQISKLTRINETADRIASLLDTTGVPGSSEKAKMEGYVRQLRAAAKRTPPTAKTPIVIEAPLEIIPELSVVEPPDATR